MWMVLINGEIWCGLATEQFARNYAAEVAKDYPNLVKTIRIVFDPNEAGFWG